ncbi:hypothetical protein CC80DRAFT_60052 [Byssothecium circinans]|uniref:Uncharacterized protein n=1 Tax=Byssothecium circinans TaxID=147558 RepID=A0A6A5TV64_9PLEO|nr:hypothetical protein CC80DRAFT_60052 [Byssothecium circinans]
MGTRAHALPRTRCMLPSTLSSLSRGGGKGAPKNRGIPRPFIIEMPSLFWQTPQDRVQSGATIVARVYSRTRRNQPLVTRTRRRILTPSFIAPECLLGSRSFSMTPVPGSSLRLRVTCSENRIAPKPRNMIKHKDRKSFFDKEEYDVDLRI